MLSLRLYRAFSPTAPQTRREILLETASGTRGPLPGCMQVSVDEALLEEVLGARRFLEHDAAHRVQEAGSVAGLVWTEAGGQLQYVECAATSAGVPGRRGALQMTGQVRVSRLRMHCGLRTWLYTCLGVWEEVEGDTEGPCLNGWQNDVGVDNRGVIHGSALEIGYESGTEE